MEFGWLKSETKTEILARLWADNKGGLTGLAEGLNISLPSLLEHLSELEKLGILQKIFLTQDKRVKNYETNWKVMAKIWVDFAKDDFLSTIQIDEKIKHKIEFKELDLLAKDKRFIEFVEVYLSSSTDCISAFKNLYEHLVNFWVFYAVIFKYDKNKDFDFLKPLLFEKEKATKRKMGVVGYYARGKIVDIESSITEHIEHLYNTKFRYLKKRPKKPSKNNTQT